MGYKAAILKLQKEKSFPGWWGEVWGVVSLLSCVYRSHDNDWGIRALGYRQHSFIIILHVACSEHMVAPTTHH